MGMISDIIHEQYEEEIKALKAKVSELDSDLKMVLASQERQRQLNDAQSVKLESAREVIEKAKGILEVVVEVNDDECYFDHHGYCQAHNLETDCHVERAREWMKQKMVSEES